MATAKNGLANSLRASATTGSSALKSAKSSKTANHTSTSLPSIRFSIERSLKRLNTDRIELVLVHSDGNDLDVINSYGILDVLADIKQEGKIGGFGMSTKTVEGGLLAAGKSDCVMVTYNLNHREEESVIDYCLQTTKRTFEKGSSWSYCCKR